MFRLLQISLITIFLILLLSCGSFSKSDKKTDGSESFTSQEPKREIVLLYPGSDQLLHPYKSFIENNDNNSSELEEVVREYLNLNPSPDLVNPFPQNTKLRAVYFVGEDRAVVDFYSMASDGGGVEEETFRIYGIINTINFNFPEIKAVKIIVEGQEKETFMGHVDISNFIPPEPSLNGKEIQ